MKSKKIRLLQTLSCGIVGAGGVSVGTVLVMNSINVDTRIDLSTKSGQLNSLLAGEQLNETLLTCFTTQNGISEFNDLSITQVNQTNKTFSVVTKSNSAYFKDNTQANCSWRSPADDGDWTQITGTLISSDIQVYEDENATRTALLNDLKVQYEQFGLDVNQLYIDMSGFNQDTKSATVRTADNSSLYNPTKTATIIAGFTAASSLTYSNSTLTQDVVSTVPTFSFKGSTVTPTYTISPAASSPVSFTNGTINFTKNTNFAGCMYTVTASYANSGNTYISRAQVYVQAYAVKAVLTISNTSITQANKNSGTATMTVDGTTVTPNSWEISPAAPSAQGLSFATGRLTWDGTKDTSGAIYTITGTVTSTGIKASAQVFVNQILLVQSMTTAWQTGWTVNNVPFKIGRSAYMPYCVISNTATVAGSMQWINDNAFKPTAAVQMQGSVDDGSGKWISMGLIVYNTDGKLSFYGGSWTANTSFRITGEWVTN